MHELILWTECQNIKRSICCVVCSKDKSKRMNATLQKLFMTYSFVLPLLTRVHLWGHVVGSRRIIIRQFLGPSSKHLLFVDEFLRRCQHINYAIQRRACLCNESNRHGYESSKTILSWPLDFYTTFLNFFLTGIRLVSVFLKCYAFINYSHEMRIHNLEKFMSVRMIRFQTHRQDDI
jgi:hypothetical protein